jgi:leucyl-tRNA synthetase
MVISPEHPYIEKWGSQLANLDEVLSYREEAGKKSDFERTEINKEKTGREACGRQRHKPGQRRGDSHFVSDYVS